MADRMRFMSTPPPATVLISVAMVAATTTTLPRTPGPGPSISSTERFSRARPGSLRCSVGAFVDYGVLTSLLLFHLRRRRSHREGHLVDGAGKSIVAFLVVFGHGRSEILADVFSFIGREDERL